MSEISLRVIAGACGGAVPSTTGQPQNVFGVHRSFELNLLSVRRGRADLLGDSAQVAAVWLVPSIEIALVQREDATQVFVRVS